MSLSSPKIRVEEQALTGENGVTLHRRSVLPDNDPPPWASLVFLHGYGDHSGRHLPCMRWLAERGVGCHAMDFRGHGRASGRRGYVVRWDEYLDDLEAFLRAAPLTPPLFLLGQSHGGLVLAAAVIRGLPALMESAGVIFSAPYFGSLIPVPPATALLARIADRTLPWLPFPTRFQAEWLGGDAALQAEDRADTLSNRVATPRWYVSTLAAQADALERAALFRLPLLLLTGDADPVADVTASRLFFERAGSSDKTCRVYPGYRHEPLREVGREAVFEEVLQWLRERRNAAAVSPAAL